ASRARNSSRRAAFISTGSGCWQNAKGRANMARICCMGGQGVSPMKPTDYPLRSRWCHALWPMLLTVANAHAADRVTGHGFATRSEVYAPHAMAATSQPLATQIALDVMKNGGSAVDAAIAADAALGLMEPTGAGMGGDLFAIVWDPKTRKLHGYNGSGRSPKSITLAEFQKRGLKDVPSYGPLPVSVPGCVDGWFALHERFGRLPR